MPTTANSGSRSRMLDHDKALPCGSASTSSTRPPATASVAATLTATVVLPTPPLRLSTPMIIAPQHACRSGTRSAALAGRRPDGGYRNDVGVRSVSIGLDQADPVSPPHVFDTPAVDAIPQALLDPTARSSTSPPDDDKDAQPYDSPSRLRFRRSNERARHAVRSVVEFPFRLSESTHT